MAVRGLKIMLLVEMRLMIDRNGRNRPVLMEQL